MEAIYLDGCEMTSRERLHEYLREQMELPEYYGENLDALYDVLSTWGRDVELYLAHADEVEHLLGEYGRSFIETLQDAEEESSHVRLVLE